MPVTVPKHTWSDFWLTHSARAATMLFRARRAFVRASGGKHV